jgi:hypothetical protein
MINETDPDRRRNNSDLSPADCWNRLTNERYKFEEMSDDDLDSIYAIAFSGWAYHLTRQAYIDALYRERSDIEYNEARKDDFHQRLP